MCMACGNVDCKYVCMRVCDSICMSVFMDSSFLWQTEEMWIVSILMQI